MLCLALPPVSPSGVRCETTTLTEHGFLGVPYNKQVSSPFTIAELGCDNPGMEPLIFGLGGKTYGRSAQVDVVVEVLAAKLTKSAIEVRVEKIKLFSPNERHTYCFPFSESKVALIEESRSPGKAAVGAIAGTLIAGPIGLLAGAAIGAKKKRTLVVRHAQASLVFEASAAEVQDLIARGLM